MSKYYTPEIEEFHVGFEYEDKFFDYPEEEKNWKKRVYEVNDSYSLQLISTRIKLDRIRVKYLDREDIESLGFRLAQEGANFYVYLKDTKWTLHTNPAYPRKIDLRCNHPSWKYGQFLGTIKNKSELKKLLKQSGI